MQVTKPFIKDLAEKHQKALLKFYHNHGVGDLPTQRFAFWESQHSGGYSISRVKTKRDIVRVFELNWLVDHFPQDFPSF